MNTWPAPLSLSVTRSLMRWAVSTFTPPAYDGVAERFEIGRVKNRFANPTFCGFRDCLCNVDVEGHICEIQIHVTEVNAIAKRSYSHAHY